MTARMLALAPGCPAPRWGGGWGAGKEGARDRGSRGRASSPRFRALREAGFCRAPTFHRELSRAPSRTGTPRLAAATATADGDGDGDAPSNAIASSSCPGAKPPWRRPWTWVLGATSAESVGVPAHLALDAASPGWWNPPAPYGVAPTPALSSTRDIGPPGRYADGAWWRGRASDLRPPPPRPSSSPSRP